MWRLRGGWSKKHCKKGGRLYGRGTVVMNGKTYYTDKQIRMYRHAMTMRNHSVWQGECTPDTLVSEILPIRWWKHIWDCRQCLTPCYASKGFLKAMGFSDRTGKRQFIASFKECGKETWHSKMQSLQHIQI